MRVVAGGAKRARLSPRLRPNPQFYGLLPSRAVSHDLCHGPRESRGQRQSGGRVDTPARGTVCGRRAMWVHLYTSDLPRVAHQAPFRLVLPRSPEIQFQIPSRPRSSPPTSQCASRPSARYCNDGRSGTRPDPRLPRDLGPARPRPSASCGIFTLFDQKAYLNSHSSNLRACVTFSRSSVRPGSAP